MKDVTWKRLALTSDIPSSLPASDVHDWAKAAKKPSYSWNEIGGLGSLATKNSLSAGDVGALPTSGGTMTGDITFAATGTTGTSNKISFSGSTDGAQIYYNVPSSDQGNLIFNMTDDTNAYIQFAQNGTVHSYISPADGTYHGNISGSAGSVAWGNVSDKPSTYPPSSHTHTKAQVGLSNVANLDQSKAIKSITRNGTTFTATALDGTTSTFTQQDTNTTYDIATSSTDGLMSKTDKAKLDAVASTYATKSELSSHSQNTSNPHKVTASQVGALPISGGSMTGQILTSFRGSVAVGSYQASATTVPDLVQELRYSSGCMGSANLGKYNSMPGGWYNFIYIPHRTGGINGSANGDNCNFGSLILIGMTMTNQAWIVEFQAEKIVSYFSIRNTDTTYPIATSSTDGLMSKTDKAKLDGIGAGANVKSVNGKTGAVTLAKGDVGLGSVANLDQSKAIKSITRNGTTFTATALDGTTTTFTQQDNNTTYGLASQSSNGLMSAADKKAIDREFFRMLPKGTEQILTLQHISKLETTISQQL